MSTTNSNLTTALNVVKLVSAKSILRSNKPGDFIRSGGNSAVCTYNLRDKVDGIKNGLHQKHLIFTRALLATKERCGNCQELASVAFMELRQQGLSPVDFWRLTNQDHAFVMIGRVWATNPNDPLLWGGDATICDPWMGKAYAAPDLFKFWPGAIPELQYTFSRS